MWLLLKLKRAKLFRKQQEKFFCSLLNLKNYYFTISYLTQNKMELL